MHRSEVSVIQGPRSVKPTRSRMVRCDMDGHGARHGNRTPKAVKWGGNMDLSSRRPEKADPRVMSALPPRSGAGLALHVVGDLEQRMRQFDQFVGVFRTAQGFAHQAGRFKLDVEGTTRGSFFPDHDTCSHFCRVDAAIGA